MYCLNLMRIALELALHNRAYEDIARKFFEHFLHIAEAMTSIGGAGTAWASGTKTTTLTITIRCVVTRRARPAVSQDPFDRRADSALRRRNPGAGDARPSCRDFETRLKWFLSHRPEMARGSCRGGKKPGMGERRLLVPAARPPDEEAAPADARRNRVSRRTTAMRSQSRRSTAASPTRSRRDDRHDAQRRLSAGRIAIGVVRRQTRTGQAGPIWFPVTDYPDHRVAAEVPSLLWRRFQGRMSDRLGPDAHDSRRSRRGAEPPASSRHLPARPRRPPPLLRCNADEAARPIRSSATTCSSTSTSTATPAAA